MRRLILALLFASTAATSAFAQSSPAERRAAREHARSERAEGSDVRAERRDRKDERAQVPARALVPRDTGQRRLPMIERSIDRGRATTAVDRDRPQRAQDRNPGERATNRPQLGRASRDSVATWRQEQRDRARGGRSDSISDLVRRGRVTPPREARPDRPAPRPRTVSRARTSPRWAASWHNDRRYDWRDHRRRHGSLFRLGFYFDPFGWRYQRYGRGWRLWPSYYDSSYWLNDPFMYRLPYAPYPYKWVRYWDDALLVDTFTGEVVDVAHDFFW